MPTLQLVQGPPGAGKSGHARELLAAGTVALWADTTRLWSATGGHERDPETGRFPIREDDDPALLAGLYLKTATVRYALREGHDVVVTGATRSAEAKWRAVVEEFDNVTMSLTTMDPGKAVVIARLIAADDADRLKDACERAVARWYDG